MPKRYTIGTAVSQPGTIQYGKWEAFTHPTGHTEFLPVIIAQGREDGPCFWLTAGIHGPEHAGPVVLYRLLTQVLMDQLKGTLVMIPALSPAGLREAKRVPYHDSADPNRLWPDGRPPKKETDPEKNPPSPLEDTFAALFAVMQETADYLIDYHNSAIDSVSFSFRDRVLYRPGPDAAKNKAAAEALAARQYEMLQAYGHPIINEYPAEKYIDDKLHRSTSGATLLVAGIPSFTVELSTGLMPRFAVVDAALAGTRNVLRWAGMLPGEMEPITGIVQPSPGFPVRRSRALRVDTSCLVLPLAREGDIVRAGDPVAHLVDIWGRPVGEGVLRAKYDGFVLGRSSGIYFYAGASVYYMAVRDDAPLVGPYPDDYFD